MAHRILITGASGLIGRHVVPALLARGDEVHAVSRAAGLPAGVVQHRADLLSDAGSVVRAVRPSQLLHLAWTTEHGKFWSDPANRQWQRATVGLARAFAACGGGRFVAAGTCAEYGWGHAGAPLSEARTPLVPRTLYGQAKNETRAELESLLGPGVSFAWGRVFFLFGPGESAARFVPSVALPLLEGRPATCGAPSLERDFLAAEDVAGAFVALLSSDVTGAVNIASGETRSLGEIARELAELAGRPDLLELGAKGPTAENPAVLAADVARLGHEVGWRPPHPLQERLREYVAALRAG
jgi:nucleoside-diphosphate-sugar epimerase